MIAKPWPGEKVPGTRLGSFWSVFHCCSSLFGRPGGLRVRPDVGPPQLVGDEQQHQHADGDEQLADDPARHHRGALLGGLRGPARLDPAQRRGRLLTGPGAVRGYGCAPGGRLRHSWPPSAWPPARRPPPVPRPRPARAPPRSASPPPAREPAAAARSRRARRAPAAGSPAGRRARVVRRRPAPRARAVRRFRWPLRAAAAAAPAGSSRGRGTTGTSGRRTRPAGRGPAAWWCVRDRRGAAGQRVVERVVQLPDDLLELPGVS